MLVEFVRAVSPLYASDGEDDGISGVAPSELVIGIEPDSVAAAFESTETGVVIIRLRDGRGFKVKGTYAEVSAKLRGAPAAPRLVAVPTPTTTN